MTPSEFFRKLEQSFPDLQRKLLVVAAVETENFNATNFANEGFFGDPFGDSNDFSKWQERKESPKKKVKNNRPLLVKTGDLKRAATTALPMDDGIAFVFNAAYMKAHNEGVQGRLPKRQFIGRSAALDKILKRKWRTIITNHLKNL